MKTKYFWMVGSLVGFIMAASVWAGTVNVNVIDMAGRSVTAPLNPQRIVCLGPGALRLIVYLQAENKVVGVEDMEKMYPGGRPYWIAHPELFSLPRCGPGGPAGINKKPDLESVLAVQPQVIFITYMDAPLAEEVQRTLDIPVVVLSYGAFAAFDETVYDALRLAGRILNREKRAEEIIGYINALRNDLHKRTARIPSGRKPSVYVGGIGYRGGQGIESSEKRFTPFDWVNADNAVDSIEQQIGSHVFLGKEQLLRLNPDVIFIDGGGLAMVAEDYRKKPEYYNALQAFAEGRIYTLLPFNWYTTNIETALADAFAIGKIIYRESFEDLDPEQKADEIYAFMVGKPVYAAMKKDYGAIGQKASFLNAP